MCWGHGWGGPPAVSPCVGTGFCLAGAKGPDPGPWGQYSGGSEHVCEWTWSWGRHGPVLCPQPARRSPRGTRGQLGALRLGTGPFMGIAGAGLQQPRMSASPLPPRALLGQCPGLARPACHSRPGASCPGWRGYWPGRWVGLGPELGGVFQPLLGKR